MRLNLPVLDALTQCHNLLIAGMGGGFDIFCGLPIYFELQQKGLNVHLANFSFSEIETFSGGIRLSDTLVGVTPDYDGLTLYFPELYLAQWFKAEHEKAMTIWCFQKTGAIPLLENYRILVEHLSIDGVLLIDGGVDSLMRGDEREVGTLIEDTISLFVVNELEDIPVRLMGCLGFGAELDMTYAHVFENIARLTAAEGFLGSCALTPQMEVYQTYEKAVLYVQGQERQDSSVINSSVISAVQGHYGDYHLTEKTNGSRLWISPLMSLYWFFDLPTVAQQNLYLSQLAYTNTFLEAFRRYTMFRQMVTRRRHERIPLT